MTILLFDFKQLKFDEDAINFYIRT